MICHKCLFKLETVFEFRSKCMDVNSILLKHLESHIDNVDVQKYWTAVKESLRSEESSKECVGKKQSSVKNHCISNPDDGFKPIIVQTAKHVTRPSGDGSPTATEHGTRTVQSEPTIGARDVRVTRSGNVSGGIAGATVFQEVFLDEAGSEGFLPEQPDGDCVQDVLVSSDSSAAQKRKKGVEEAPLILTVETIKKEPGSGEEHSPLSPPAARTTAAQPICVPAVTSPSPEDPGSQNIDSTPVKLRRFVCKTCNFKSANKLKMKEHLCAFPTTLSCALCARYFYSKASLAKHKLRGTCTKGFKKCPRCSNQFKTLEELARHQTVHFKVIACTKEEDLHPCDCGMRFVCKLMLASHRLAQHKDSDVKDCDKNVELKCEVCARVFNNYRGHNNHMRVHSLSEKLLKAKNDVKSYSRLKGSNMEKNRLTDVVIRCEDCSRVFFKRSSYVNHIKIHEMQREGESRDGWKSSSTGSNSKFRRRKCKQCGAVLSSRSAWLNHVRRHVTKSKINVVRTENESEIPSARPIIGIFQCSTCGKSFSSKSAKMHHQISHEMGNRKCFTCEICHRKLMTKEGHVLHMEAHHKVHCDTCHKYFESDEALRTHVCGVGGNGILQFQCPSCPAVFSTRNGVSGHLNTHKKRGVTLDQCPAQDEVSIQPLHEDLPTSYNENNEVQPVQVGKLNEKQVLYKLKNGYKCGICAKITVTLHGGKAHMKSHSVQSKKKNRNFKCPFCSSSFASVSATNVHIATNHPDTSVQ
ncbi:zinc finger protein ZFMSA12A-like isoform X2 [Bacillus rossius redtenbacheri]